MRVWANVCQARIQDTYKTEENLLDTSVLSPHLPSRLPHAQGFTPSQASTSAPAQTRHLMAFSTTPGGCLWGPQPSLDNTAPSSRPRPSLFRSFPLIHSTHTHTHPSPSSPVQISIPALEKPSPLILQQFKPDPQHGLL